MLILQEIFGYFLIGLMGTGALAVLFLPLHFAVRKKISRAKEFAGFLCIACVLIILSATVFDAVFANLQCFGTVLSNQHTLILRPFHTFSESWAMGERKKITQILANFLMFVPLGFIFPAAFQKGRSFLKSTVCIAVFSFSIEFVQYFIGRSADIDDFLLNTLGGITGYLLFTAFHRLWKKMRCISTRA